MQEKIIKIKGKKKGKTSMIIVGTHGNEVCGVLAMNELLNNLKIDRGTVYIAYGNPKAVEQNVRFTEQNLNRLYRPIQDLTDQEKKSYEFKRATYLKKYLDKSDSLLDIHASTNKKSKPFIICERNSKNISNLLPFQTIVYGFDKNEPGGTDYYMNRIGKNGICIECGYLADAKSTIIAKESILSYLKICGNINDPKIILTKQKKKYIQIYKKYYSQTSNFRLNKNFADFEIIKEGQTIGTDGRENIICDRKSIILFPNNSNKVGDEVFLLGKII